jgi:hypothetical protein
VTKRQAQRGISAFGGPKNWGSSGFCVGRSCLLWSGSSFRAPDFSGVDALVWRQPLGAAALMVTSPCSIPRVSTGRGRRRPPQTADRLPAPGHAEPWITTAWGHPHETRKTQKWWTGGELNSRHRDFQSRARERCDWARPPRGASHLSAYVSIELVADASTAEHRAEQSADRRVPRDPPPRMSGSESPHCRASRL